MTKKNLGILFLAWAMGGFSAPAMADEAPIYGSQLMTRQERIAYRNQLRNAQTAEAREQIRLQHHEQMQLRAKERGVTLPDAPPPQGAGMGRRMGPGGGMGPGMGGMGPGRNR
ncbi:MAG: hypothetical protein ACK4FE_13335 [Azonexus sp.]